MAGIQNFPISEPGFDNFMTMKVIGAGQTFPFPGKLARRTAVAGQKVNAAVALADAAKCGVAQEVRTGYYDVAFSTSPLLTLVVIPAVYSLGKERAVMRAGVAHRSAAEEHHG